MREIEIEDTRATLIILHDYFESAEGGGRLCLTLGRALEAALVYGFKSEKHPFFKAGYVQGKEYGLNAYSRLRVWKQIKLIRAFSRKTAFLNRYQIALFSGFYSVCSASNHTRGKNIYYCHTPPRFMYDQQEKFKEQAGIFGRPVLKKFINYYRPIYEDALSRMNLLVTNSKNVQDRIKTFLGLESVVVYPPCDTKKFRFLGQENYYLSTARLDSLKRVDLIVKAFLKMPDKHLIVVSGGPEAARIKRIVAKAHNISVLGWVDEKKLSDLLGNCIATIYIPKEEDFGMSPLESMASGKPVLGVKEGGLLETVLNKKTGYLLPKNPTNEDVIRGVEYLDKKRSTEMREECRKRAMLFDQDIFIKNMKLHLNA